MRPDGASEMITSSCVYESTETAQSFGDDTRAVVPCLREYESTDYADVRPGLSSNVQTSGKTDKDKRKKETQRRRDTETERHASRETDRDTQRETQRERHGETH